MKKIIEFLIYIFSSKVYYFAYGSNMSKDRLVKRIGYCTKVNSVYKLEGYKLTFDYGSSTKNFANVQEDENSRVLGVVYKITRRQLEMLDYYEGCGNPNYYMRMTELFNNYPIFFYISFNTVPFIGIPKDYLDTLLQGRKENNLECDDIKNLQTIDEKMFK